MFFVQAEEILEQHRCGWLDTPEGITYLEETFHGE